MIAHVFPCINRRSDDRTHCEAEIESFQGPLIAQETGPP